MKLVLSYCYHTCHIILVIICSKDYNSHSIDMFREVRQDFFTLKIQEV